MENLLYQAMAWLSILGGCILSLGLTLILLHFNGRIIAATLDRLRAFLQPKPIQTQSTGDASSSQPGLAQTAAVTTIFLLGLTPFALAGLLMARLQTCWQSPLVLAAIEGVVLLGFVSLPRKARQTIDISGWKTLRRYRNGVGLALLWCAVFSFWIVCSLQPGDLSGGEYLLINRNPDIWAYTRRFAAFTTTNLSFDGQSACDYLLISPKKMSSLIGSLYVAFSPTPAMGSLMFQTTLGSSLFLLLFWEWKQLFSRKRWTTQTRTMGSVLGIAWALSSPPIFWLMISSYFSNTLFLLIIFLGLRTVRSVALSVARSPEPMAARQFELPLVVIGLSLCIAAFYPAGLPVALFVWFVASVIYSPEKTWRSRLSQQALLGLWAGLAIILIYFCFLPQFTLEEVQATSNPLLKHGSNFVPLNPWSLVQEKPKPMGATKDFGVWFHVVVGLIFSGLSLRFLWRRFSAQMLGTAETIVARVQRSDLWAGLAGLLFYASYLLAYFAFDSTYRLAKIAISVIWPLAILVLLPVVFWVYGGWRDRFPRAAPVLALGLLLLHVALHVEKVDYLRSRVVGQYSEAQALTQTLSSEVERVVVTRCSDTAKVQHYERIVGLRLAREYPQLTVEVDETIVKGDEPENHQADTEPQGGNVLYLKGENLVASGSEDFNGIKGCRY